MCLYMYITLLFFSPLLFLPGRFWAVYPVSQAFILNRVQTHPTQRLQVIKIWGTFAYLKTGAEAQQDSNFCHCCCIFHRAGRRVSSQQGTGKYPIIFREELFSVENQTLPRQARFQGAYQVSSPVNCSCQDAVKFSNPATPLPIPWLPPGHGHKTGRSTAPHRGDRTSTGQIWVQTDLKSLNTVQQCNLLALNMFTRRHSEASQREFRLLSYTPAIICGLHTALIDKRPTQDHLPQTQKGRAATDCCDAAPAPHP